MIIMRKNVLKLTGPILLEQVFVMAMGMINTMMAGSIGKEAVAAIGMVDSINNIFIAFFSALAVGGTVVVAQYIGKGNIKRANEAMKQALYSSVFICIVITILIYILRVQIIGALFSSAEHSVMKNALIYIGITLLTYPLISIELVSNGVLRGAGNTKTPMKITMLMNIINVVLTRLFIEGLYLESGNFHILIPSMGIKGAALGIAVARTTGAVVAIIVLLRGTNSIRLSKLHKYKPDKQLLKPIYGVGIPASIESLLFNSGKLITQVYIVSMGTISMSANVIAGSIVSMLNVPGNALCTAATTLVGQFMGKEKPKDAEKCLSYIIKMSVVAMFILAVSCVPIARLVSSLYSNDSRVISLSAKLIRLNAIFIPVWSFSFVLPAGLKGAGDVRYTLVTTLIGMWLFRITLGYFLGIPLGLGLEGVWLGMFIDWCVRGTLYFLRFRNGKWQTHRVV